MHRFTHWFTRRRGLIGLVAALIALIGLQGCFRGGWHGRSDPARFEERMSDVQADIAEELEIQPHQQAQFDALMARYKELVRDWRTSWRTTADAVYGGVQTQPADLQVIGEALKQRYRARPEPAVVDQLVDDTIAFYRTLTPEQQEHVREHIEKHLRRHRG